MSENLFEKFSALNDLRNALEFMNNITIQINSRTRQILADPYEYYKRTLNIDGYSTKSISRIKNHKPASLFDGPAALPFNFEEEVNKILENKVLPSIRSNQSFPELSLREYRYLSWYYDFPTKAKDLYIIFLDKLIQNEKITSRIFQNILEVYFNKYNLFMANKELFERFKKICALYEEKNKIRNKWLDQVIKNKRFYLSEEAPLMIAKSALYTRKESSLTINEIMNTNLRNTYGDLLSETYKELGLICFKNCNDQFYLDILLNEILMNDNIDKFQLDELVSKVILAFKSSSDVNATACEKIKRCLLLHKGYGDPRINSLNWSRVNIDALKIFKNWLAKDDIEFFFKVIFDDVNDHQQRKAFWMRYLKSILNSRVVISDYHKQLNLLELKKAKEEGRTFAEFTFSPQASCFIMDFEKFYAVEFSDSGNALYIYKKDAINLDLSKRYISRKELKDSKNAYLVRVSDIFEDREKYYIYSNLSHINSYDTLRFRHSADTRYNLISHKNELVWHTMVDSYFNYLGIWQDSPEGE